MKKLVFAEKPSVARDIARVLQCTKKQNGFIEGPQYIVTWGLGHLVTLADPEQYSDQYKTWRLEDLPMLPKPFKLEVIKETKSQFHTVKTQMHRKDVNEIIIATDAGREGELVARWVIELAKVKKPIKRLWISSVTDQAIRDGFRNLKNGQAYERLYASAEARAQADWVVGMNASRALTCKFNAQLSCGRVQTPTLAMIARREDEIRHFQPVPYYGLTALVKGNLKLTWQEEKSNSYRSFDESKIDQLLKRLHGQQAIVKSVDQTKRKTYAPALYDLTELQRDANRRFGLSPKETSNVMQRLYEQHKLLTYPRTDSRYLSSDIVPTLVPRLRACAIGPYRTFANDLIRIGLKTGPHVVDDRKVSDHHAIIPTDQPLQLQQLNDIERKIYDLVIKRFLAVFMPAHEYEQITLKVQIANELFIARGRRVILEGWHQVLGNINVDEEQESNHDDDSLTEQVFPSISKGQTFQVQDLRKTRGETKPPARFNEASLLSAMENPLKFIDNNQQQLAQTLKDTGGLGTVATRADIIEKLFASFLIEKTGKEIRITRKGEQLLQLVPADLRTPILTAQWERKLERIANGQLEKQVFVAEMYQYATQAVSEISRSSQTYRHDNISRTPCPDCGKPMLDVKDKKGRLLVCQDRQCGSRQRVAQTSNARCPDCRKKLELRGSGEAQTFYCVCGHREKLSTFLERKQANNGVSKREVAQFMKQQQQETNQQSKNSALADALANLKLLE